MTSGTAARDQAPETGTAPHSAWDWHAMVARPRLFKHVPVMTVFWIRMDPVHIVITVFPAVWLSWLSSAATSSRLSRVIGGGITDPAATQDASRSSSGTVVWSAKFTPVTPARASVCSSAPYGVVTAGPPGRTWGPGGGS